MHKRFLSLWFCHLTTDRLAIRHPELKEQAFVLVAPERGRMVVKASSSIAADYGILPGMVVADARAILPTIGVFTYKPGWEDRLLANLAEWCLRYTPVVAPDSPDGLMLDISGCAHLWGGESPYLKHIITTFKNKGYDVNAAIADTMGTAWAVCRYGPPNSIVAPHGQRQTLLSLPPASLRLEQEVLQRMSRLGFRKVRQFIDLPASMLRRRFGEPLLIRIGQALGTEHEHMEPVQPQQPYREQLPSLEPICTAPGIAIALKRLLETVCQRLTKEGKGLRTGIFKGYRLDGKVEQVSIGTGRASRNLAHLFKLFELKLPSIEPGLGIELFEFEAPLVEKLYETQESLWHTSGDATAIAELLDRLAGKIGRERIHRYLPQEHHWPERSIKAVSSLDEQPETAWRTDSNRPLCLLPEPEPIEVMTPLPDYPPLHFRYKGQVFMVVKADGPERIEQEWWISDGPPRDYYCVEDGDGARYWLFRLDLYEKGEPRWFLHGFFA
jgi:protein ImuB